MLESPRSQQGVEVSERRPGDGTGEDDGRRSGEDGRAGRGGGVSNTLSGGTAREVVMARDISGGVHFHATASLPAVPGGRVRPPVYLPPHAGELFIGRHGELARLDEAFGLTAGTGSPAAPGGDGTAAHRQQRHQVGVLYGLGGIGKSTLAAHWSALRRVADQAVWWIVADGAEAVGEGLAGLGAALLGADAAGRPLEALAEHAIGWLNGHGDWSLVLDNVHRPADIEPLLARLAGAVGGRVLITTRLGTGWGRITRQVIALDVLPLDQAVELLATAVAAERPNAALDGADELCLELGCLPLAIEQAAGHLAADACSPRAYLHRLTAYPADLYARTAPGSDQVDRTVARVWHSTLDRLAAESPLAGTVLRIAAWWAPQNIPRALLSPLPALLAAVGPPDRRCQAPDGVEGGWRSGDEAVRHAVARLAAYNMITLSGDGQAVGVHRLVQAVARTPVPAGVPDPHRQRADIDTARDQATALLDHACPADPDDPDGWPVWRVLLPHIEALTVHASPGTDTPSTSRLLNTTGGHLRGQGALARARSYFERALAADLRLHGDGHPHALIVRHNLALVHLDAGEPEQATALYEQVVADMARVLGEDHPHTLSSRNNLASAYRDAGDVERAITLHEQVLAGRARVLGEHHPETLASRHHLAKGYRDAGDLERAIALYERVLADRARVLGDDHPDTLTSRSNLANTCHEAGEPTRAMRLYEQTLADRMRVLGKDHPDTLTSFNNLASAYRKAGRLERAIALYQQTLADCRRVLSEDHPTTRLVRRNLEAALHERDDEGPSTAP